MDRSAETMKTMIRLTENSWTLILGVAVIFSGCGGSRDASRSDESSNATEEMRKQEALFNPSEYNQDVKAFLQEEFRKEALRKETPKDIANPAPPDLVPGFRVQIFASTNIDEATKQKEAAEGIFPDEWFYLIYDPPTYKARAGNFISRFEADRFLKQVSQSGFRDAWVVPDRVYKNPLPRSAQPPPEPPHE